MNATDEIKDNTSIERDNAMTEQIKNYLHIDGMQTQKGFIGIYNFLILWNIFEATLFNCYFGENKRDISKIRMDENSRSVNDALAYFRSRYTTDGKMNERFLDLAKGKKKFSDEYKKLIQDVLLGNPGAHNKVKAIILLIARYRNKLFHGAKTIASLPKQEDNFLAANEFLMACIKAGKTDSQESE